MHVPIGRSGVHAVPNTLHSHGLIAPISTSPHWHAFGSSTRSPGQLEPRLGVPRGELGPQPERAPLDPAEPAPLERVAQLHRLLERRERARVAVAAHDARVLVLDLAAALAQLAQEHHDRLEDVERLERRDDDRLAVARRR